MLVVVDENIPQWQLFADNCQVVRLPGRSISNADVRNADALIVRSITKVNQQLLAGSKVRFVGTCTIGTDHLDLDYLQHKDIAWSNAPGCNAQAVVEYVLACLQTLANYTGRDLLQLRYGVVGVGQVGGRLARALQALGVQVVLCDPPRQQAGELAQASDLHSLLRSCDVVSLHTPLVNDGRWPSRHLLSAAELNLLPKQAWLINAARGAVIDNQALLECLRQRNDLQVVLDVWEHEPDFMPELAQLCRIATPHIAGYSLDGKILGTQMIAASFAKHFALDEVKQAQYPVAPIANLQLDAQVEPREQLATLAGLLYNPLQDDLALRQLIALPAAEKQQGFDWLRKNYPPRRELATLGRVAGIVPELAEFARVMSMV